MLSAGLVRAGIQQSAFATAFARVRDLEFYMPVAEHRRAWSGGDVLVAAGMTEERDPIAYDGAGKRIVLSIDQPPETPVLVITPRETDFFSSTNPNSSGGISPSRASNDKTTLLSPPKAPLMTMAEQGVLGLYASFIRVMDEAEPWIRGDPELEIIIVGMTHQDGKHRPYQCSGEFANSLSAEQPGIRAREYVYNQDGRFFEGSPGPMLLSPTQLDHIHAWDPEGFFITFWEDDDTSCGIREKSPDEILADLWEVAVETGAAILAKPTWKGVFLELLSWTMATTTLLDLIQGGDDYIGVAVDKARTSWANDYPDNTHIILTGANEFAGRATLNVRQTSRTVLVSGPSTVGSYETSFFSSYVTGASGSQRYVWSVYLEGSEQPTVVQDGTLTALEYTNTGVSFRVLLHVTDDIGDVGSSSVSTWVNDCVEEPGGLECPT